MRRNLIPAAAVALLLASCVSSGGDAGRLVPADAYAAVVAESPAGLFRSAEAFVREAGLDRFTKRSEEHTSELQSTNTTAYAVFCLKKKTIHNNECQ